MPRIDVPDGPGDVTKRVWDLRPLLGDATDRMRKAAFEDSELPARLRELVRFRIAELNGCALCLSFRDPAAGDVEPLLGASKDDPRLDDRERRALDYAERFVLDHRSIDDAYLAELRRHFDDGEVVDLTFVIARHLAFGRFTTVLGLDDACPLPGR